MKLNTQNTSELESGQPQGYYYKEIQPKEENDLSEKQKKEWKGVWQGMDDGDLRYGLWLNIILLIKIILQGHKET